MIPNTNTNHFLFSKRDHLRTPLILNKKPKVSRFPNDPTVVDQTPDSLNHEHSIFETFRRRPVSAISL